VIWQLDSFFGESGSIEYHELESVELQDGVWYSVLMRISASGRFYFQLWERDNPTEYLVDVSSPAPLSDWGNTLPSTWDFMMSNMIGTLYVDAYKEILFPSAYEMPIAPSQFDFVN
jgi:hypothetical protein